MARGNDERHNLNRRPQRPQTDEEKMAIVKQVFPNAKEVASDVDEDDEIIEQMMQDERNKSYTEDDYEERHVPEDRHLDTEYESRYDSDYFYDDNGY